MEVDLEGLDGDVLGPEARATRGGPAGPVETLSPQSFALLGLAPVGEPDVVVLRPPSRGGGGSHRGTIQLRADRDASSGQAELLVVRTGTDGLRLVLPDPEASSGREAVYRVPASPGPAGGRGILSGAGRWIAQRVLFPVVDHVVGEITDRFVERWEAPRRPHRVRRWTVADYRSPEPTQSFDPATVRGPVLLIVHGTNSLSHSASGTGAITPAMLEELLRRYDGNVFAFDHPTLATDPRQNAEWLRESFLDRCPNIRSLDLLCHSRGGLVARVLAEGDGGYERVRSISMVGTPNRGTPLADASHLGRFVDRLLSIERFVPENPVTPVLEGAITVLKQVAVAGWGGLDGIAAMSPSGRWIPDNVSQPRADVDYRSLVADFEPAAGSGLWSAVKDGGLDVVFGGDMNDTIVPTIGALDLGAGPGVGFDDMVVFDEHVGILHSGYFGAAEVQPVLQAWLDPSAEARRVPIEGRFDAAGAQALASMGPEWSVERVVDLTCFAPRAVQSPLEGAVRALGGVLYSLVGARGGTGARPRVVVAPGVMGSELAVDGDRLWLSPWRLAQGRLDRLRLPAPGEAPPAAVVPVEPLCFAYRQILDHLAGAHDVIGLPYDWRLSVADAGARLRDLLVALLDDDHDGPLHLVGHSMGGLVIRHALAAMDDTQRERLRGRGGRIVQLGTPNRGSFAAPLALRGEYPPIKMLATLDIRKRIDDVLDIVWTFPGLLDLMPDPQLASGSGGTAAFLYAPALWTGRLDPPHDLAAALEGAQQRHALLAAQPGDGIELIVGDGVPTPTGVRPAAGVGFEIEMGTTGDGTVAHVCSELAGASTWYAPTVSHGDLVKDPRVLRAMGEILDHGETSLLRRAPVGVGRGAGLGAPVGGHWYSPAEAGALVEGAMPGETRGAGGGSGGTEPPWTRAASARIAVDGLRSIVGSAPPGDRLEVSVSHGDLSCARHPVLVGHAAGTPLAGAEARCDALLGGAFTSYKNLGLFPDGPDSYRYIPSGSEQDRLAGSLVVGLDPGEQVTRSTLAKLVQEATVDFANQWSSGGRTDPPCLSAVPAGSGPVLELRVEDSVAAICDGVLAANEILAANERPQVARLQFIDCYAGKVEKIVWALHAATKPGATTAGALAFDGEISEEGGARPGMPSAEYEQGRWDQLSIEVDEDGGPTPGGAGRSARLLFRRARGRAVVDDDRRTVDRHIVDDLVDQAIADPATAGEVGVQLFEDLLPLALKQEWSTIANVILQLDEDTADLPWELLADRRAGGRPFVRDTGLVRQFRVAPARSRTIAPIAAGALVIGDPPSAMAALPGAGREASEIGRVLASAGIATTVIDGPVARAAGRTIEVEVDRALGTMDSRVLHVAGHGLYRAEGDDTVGGVVVGDDVFISADTIGNLTTVPEIVFLNCCSLGQMRPGGDVLDPTGHRGEAASIARALMRAGVRALVVAGWEVDDDRAEAFATAFWGALAEGQIFGDAVSAARRAAYDEQGLDNTWAAYQAYGDPGWRLRSIRPDATAERQVVNLRSWAERKVHEVQARAGERGDLATVGPDLDQLELHVERRWPDDGGLLAALARVRGALGDFGRAVDLYDRALEDPEGRAPLWVVDQRFNLLGRLAFQGWRSDRAVDDDLQRRLEQARAQVRDLPPNTERSALIAADAKRTAVMSDPEGQPDVVEAAIAGYVTSALATGPGHAREPDLYGFRNALQLAAVVGRAETVERLLQAWWLDAWDAELQDLVDRRLTGDVWRRVGRADSWLVTALLAPEGPLREALVEAVGERAAALAALAADASSDDGTLRARVAKLYGDAVGRGREERAWSSVTEHIWVLSELARGAERHDLAEWLVALGADLEM